MTAPAEPHEARVEIAGTHSPRIVIVGEGNTHRTPGPRSFYGASMWPAPAGKPDEQSTIKDMTTNSETTQPGPIGFAKMAGSSIAGRDAAPWVTDFLNAAYFRRPVDEREVDDLR